MKGFVKGILGDGLYAKLKRVYRNYFPTEYEKQIRKKQKEFVKSKLLFYGGFIKPGDLVFDVGANMGDRVETFLSLQAKVVAVEPQDLCCKVLNDKFGDKISIEQLGLADKEGTRNFYISDGHCVSSFSEEWINSVKDDRLNNWSWSEGTPMRVSTLDNLILKYGNPSFIKIDVEGYELNVLNGLTASVDMISFEYTVPEQVSKAIDCVKYLGELDPNIKFNFSVNENMFWQLSSWLTAGEMADYINSDEFVATSQGDIYAWRKNDTI